MQNINQKLRIVTLTTLLSLVPLEIIMTISGAANHGKDGIMMTFGFQYI